MRKVIVGVLLTAFFGAVIMVFWYQEIQYLLPTPVPANYTVVLPNEVIKFDSTLIPQNHARPKLLHFFSPHCPCSRFNLPHFASLAKTYGNEVDFYVVIADKNDVAAAEQKIDPSIVIIVDEDQALAKACGVYATPQAAIIQADNKLYFRGNFNRARYCTDANSNFVQMAIDSLVQHKAPPFFNELATRSYGCQILAQQSFIPIVQ